MTKIKYVDDNEKFDAGDFVSLNSSEGKKNPRYYCKKLISKRLIAQIKNIVNC